MATADEINQARLKLKHLQSLKNPTDEDKAKIKEYEEGIADEINRARVMR